jgi:hypothetical protein
VTEDRLYTADEADAVLDELRERLVRVRDARTTMFDAARLVHERTERDGGGSGVAAGYWAAQSTLRDEVAWLARRGIALRDPESGLVDFPGERDGRRVWLCWRLGEERVGHWHELDAGFAGRRPL